VGRLFGGIIFQVMKDKMKNEAAKTPKLGYWILCRILGKNGHQTLIGDIEEFYTSTLQTEGQLRASVWYWRQVFRIFLSNLYNTLYWSVVMFSNYLKIAFRTIKRSKIYSIINIAGLAVGMACCFIILSYIISELSFDKYHKNAHRIYRLALDGSFGGTGDLRLASTNNPPAPYLRLNFPEVVNAARFRYMYRTPIKYEDKEFFEEGAYFADASVFKIFDFPLITGDSQTALATAFTVVITEDMAKKYFGNEDPIGKVLQFNNSTEYTITGVMKNVPSNSHFTFDMLCSFESRYVINREQTERWMGDFDNHTYLLLQEDYDYRELEKKLPPVVEAHMGEILNAIGGRVEYFLQPLTRIHLHSHLLGEISANGDIAYVYLFSAIAFFILLLACINFMNLTTARSTNRAKEIGVRKVHGAERTRLVRQFLGESLIYSFISLVLALALAKLALPLFSNITGRVMHVDYLKILWILPCFIGIAFLTGLIAGSYPAFYLSSFHPVKIIKGNFATGSGKNHFRNSLVIFQFTISTILIVGTLVIIKQINYMKNKQLGFDKEQLVIINVGDNYVRQSVDLIRNDLNNLPGVLRVSASSHVPGWGGHHNVHLPEGFSMEESQGMSASFIDENYIPTFGIEIAAGRNFSKNFPSDPDKSCIINETAARQFGWEDPIGKTIRPLYDDNMPRAVIGVVKDFHTRSVQQKIEPLFLWNSEERVDAVSLKLAPGDMFDTMNTIRSKWKEILPNSTFDYYFLDESLNNQYRAEERLRHIFFYFSLLAIFIACLGLFGVASFTAEKRTKEIGIRKVLGAPVTGIVTMLSKEFAKWVLIANIIAWPISYFTLNKWLQNFPYHINLTVWIFLFSTALALIVALVTVSYQSIKAAISNPINALKYE